MAVTETLLSTLTAKARQMSPFITAMAEAGKTTTEITSALQEIGEGVRRADMLAIVRAARDVVLKQPLVEAVRDEFRPTVRTMVAPITTTLRRYSFLVKLEGTDLVSGLKKTIHVTVSASNLLTMGEAKAEALALAAEISQPDSGYSSDMSIDATRAVVTKVSDMNLVQGI